MCVCRGGGGWDGLSQEIVCTLALLVFRNAKKEGSGSEGGSIVLKSCWRQTEALSLRWIYTVTRGGNNESFMKLVYTPRKYI